jgi:cyclic pyranopterin phosphate synthase
MPASVASTSRWTRSIRKVPWITRWGDLARVMAGIDAAQAAGLKVKINAASR